MGKQLIIAAAILPLFAVTACNRAETDQTAHRAAASARDIASRAGDRLADSWVTTKIQAQYFADQDMKARDIAVRTRDGVVTLTGRVDSEDLHQQALNIARYTDGVTTVDDHLAVTGAQASSGTTATSGSGAAVATTGTTTPRSADITRKDDSSVTAMVQSKYFLDPDIKVREIGVDTRNGVVTLRGDVASDNERAKALILARTTPGVDRVEDALQVNASLAPASGPGSAPAAQGPQQPPAQSVDATLTDQVRSRFAGDPQLKSTSLEMMVKDGVLLLEGSVPSAAMKQRALTIARETDGIIQVIDKISVTKRGTRR
jgi:hyperosmotically inducible protein